MLEPNVMTRIYNDKVTILATGERSRDATDVLSQVYTDFIEKPDAANRRHESELAENGAIDAPIIQF